MSHMATEYLRAQEVMRRPTIALLRKDHAPFILAVLSSAFAQNTSRIVADQFHTMVATMAEDLRLRDFAVPAAPVRQICRTWVDERWLALTPNANNEEEYALTSDARDAVDFAARHLERRSLFGESRIKLIVEMTKRAAVEANPDRETRMRFLQDQIATLQGEYDRLANGGDITAASTDQMMEQYANLRSLLDDLPRDFIRVAEDMKRLHRDIVTDFAAENRPTNEVLASYLDRSQGVLAESESGRAFLGAVELVRDPTVLSELSDDIRAILTHEFASALGTDEIDTLRRTVSMIRKGIDTVIEQRHRMSATLNTQLARRQPLRERELDDALAAVVRELATWAPAASNPTKVPVGIEVSKLDLDHLRLTLHDPEGRSEPAGIEDISDQAPEPSSLGDIRAKGGPLMNALRTAIQDRIDADGTTSLADVFNDLDVTLRRPVDVLGVLHVGAAMQGLTDLPEATIEEGNLDLIDAARPTHPLATYRSARTDGTERRLRAPNIVLTSAEHDARPNTPDTATEEAS